MDTQCCEFDLEGAQFNPPFYRQKKGMYSGTVTIPCCRQLNVFEKISRISKVFIEEKILTPCFALLEV